MALDKVLSPSRGVVKRLTPILFSLLLLGTASIQRGAVDDVVPPAVRAAAAQISGAALREDLQYIASLDREGRRTPSAGLDQAAEYIKRQIVTELRPPDPEKTFFQPIPIDLYTLDRDQSYIDVNGRRLRDPDDFGPLGLVPRATYDARGGLAYVGDGWVVENRGSNPFEQSSAKDRIVLMNLGARPAGTQGASALAPAAAASKYGAKAMVILSALSDDEWSDGARSRASATALRGVDKDTRANRPGLPALSLSPRVLRDLLVDEPHSLDAILAGAKAGRRVTPFALRAEKVLSIHLVPNIQRTETRNVVAAVEGADPKLRDEYVIVGAHYDGQGLAPDGRTNPSADDNGSGTVALMAVAKAFARGPRPRRSVLFCWWTGEEGYTLGSETFTEHPLVPTGRQVAYVNVDMVGSPEMSDALTVATSSSLLLHAVQNVNSEYLQMNLGVAESAGGSDELDPGVPILYFENENSAHHLPTDSADRIDYVKLRRAAQTIYATVWRIASLSERPRQDRKRP